MRRKKAVLPIVTILAAIVFIAALAAFTLPGMMSSSASTVVVYNGVSYVFSIPDGTIVTHQREGDFKTKFFKVVGCQISGAQGYDEDIKYPWYILRNIISGEKRWVWRGDLENLYYFNSDSGLRSTDEPGSLGTDGDDPPGGDVPPPSPCPDPPGEPCSMDLTPIINENNELNVIA